MNYNNQTLAAFVEKNLTAAIGVVNRVQEESIHRDKKRERAYEILTNDLNRAAQQAWADADKKTRSKNPPKFNVPTSFVRHIVERAVIEVKHAAPEDEDLPVPAEETPTEEEGEDTE